MSFQIGKSYGSYEIIDVLHSAREGVTYKVRNRLASRLEAMKVLAGNAQNDQEQIERFLREIRVHASMTHPNIVSFYNAAELDGRLVMTSELVEGATLAERLELGPLPWKDAIRYMAQVLSALAYAHERCVVHRDLNPSRIILTPEGPARLCGFSLAKGVAEAHLTMVGAVVGSLKYISPEQVKGIERLDGRADIYSAGAVLFEALVGRPPFDAKSQFDLMSAHVNTTAPAPSAINPNVPPELDAVVLKSLAKNPAERFQTATNFKEALESLGTPWAAAYPEGPSAAAREARLVAGAPMEPSREMTAPVAALTSEASQGAPIASSGAAPAESMAESGCESATPAQPPAMQSVAAAPMEDAAVAPEPAAAALEAGAVTPPEAAVASPCETSAEVVPETELAAQPDAPESTIELAPEAAPAPASAVSADVALKKEAVAQPDAPVSTTELAPEAAPAPASEASVDVALKKEAVAQPDAPVSTTELAPEAAPAPASAASADVASATVVPAQPAVLHSTAELVGESAVAPQVAAQPAALEATAERAPEVAAPAPERSAAAAPPCDAPVIAMAGPAPEPGLAAQPAAPPEATAPPSDPPQEGPAWSVPQTFPDRHAPSHLPIDLPMSAPVFAPPSATPVPRELMFAALLLFLVGIAAFFAFR